MAAATMFLQGGLNLAGDILKQGHPPNMAATARVFETYGSSNHISNISRLISDL